MKKHPDQCKIGEKTRGDWLFDIDAQFSTDQDGKRVARTATALFQKCDDGSGWERVE